MKRRLAKRRLAKCHDIDQRIGGVEQKTGGVQKTGVGRQRKGFTLTEVLLVMAILVMIGGMAVVGILQAQKNATRQIALTEINTMEQACTSFRLDMNRFPSKLDDLFQAPQGASPAQWAGPYLSKGDKFDPWNNEYRYEANEQSMIVQISSAGPDGTPGNEDDIPGIMRQ